MTRVNNVIDQGVACESFEYGQGVVRVRVLAVIKSDVTLHTVKFNIGVVRQLRAAGAPSAVVYFVLQHFLDKYLLAWGDAEASFDNFELITVNGKRACCRVGV